MSEEVNGGGCSPEGAGKRRLIGRQAGLIFKASCYDLGHVAARGP
jgi:hypothetical protein